MTREEVVKEAMSWLKTPYHHQARVKGAGVDCANLPAAVYEEVGLVTHINPKYSPQWMLHRDEEQFLEYIEPHAVEFLDEGQLKPGDLILWKFGRTFSHSAIVVDYPVIVHAVNGIGVVLGDAEMDSIFKDRPRKFFTLWDN